MASLVTSVLLVISLVISVLLVSVLCSLNKIQCPQGDLL